MNHSQQMIMALVIGTVALTGYSAQSTWTLHQEIDAPQANQAAAALGNHIYGIGSRVVVRYDRATGAKIDQSSGAAHHLNSGFFMDGKLYCAHSNFPKKPDRSDIKVLDPATMQLTLFKDFGESDGSLTWVVRHDNKWWCTFALYGVGNNAKTYLAVFDDNWREEQRWLYPKSVVEKLGRSSISGGLWFENYLLACGHDAAEVYQLELPQSGGELIHRGTIPVPFKGQGFAVDAVTGGMVGIDRKGKKIVLTTRKR